MVKRDVRQQLWGHEIETGEELVTRDLNRTLRCTRCGGPLEFRTISMTGQAIELCWQCGTSRPVVRFWPSEE